MLMFCIFGLLHECLGVVDGKKMHILPTVRTLSCRSVLLVSGFACGRAFGVREYDSPQAGHR